MLPSFTTENNYVSSAKTFTVDSKLSDKSDCLININKEKKVVQG